MTCQAALAVVVLQQIGVRLAHLFDQQHKSGTDFGVLMPQNLVAVRPGAVYLAPSGHHVTVVHGRADRRHSVLSLGGLARRRFDRLRPLRAAGPVVLVKGCGDCTWARVVSDSARDAGHYDHVPVMQAITGPATSAGAVPAGALPERFLALVAARSGYDFLHHQPDKAGSG